MRILLKQDDKLLLIASPDESVRIGDVFQSGEILSQTLDLQFADLPGIMEHILRQSLIAKPNISEDIQEEVKRVLETLSDQKLIITKIRGHIVEEEGVKRLKPGLTEFNLSRERTEPQILPPKELFEILDLTSSDTAISRTLGEEPITFDFLPQRLGINLITGQKGSGKSYFSKRLLLSLIRAGVFNIVFDVNGEYQNLHLDESGSNPSEFANSITILDPRRNSPDGRRLPLRIPLHELTADQFCDHTFITTEGTIAAVNQFWIDNMPGPFSLDDLETYANGLGQGLVRNKILSSVHYARSLRIFGPLDVRQIMQNLSGGGAMIINLFGIETRLKKIVVNIIQRWITRMSESHEIQSVSMFLEEAQSYVTPDEFQDLLTRMRHIGVYPTFITNDPTTLPDEVFSLADNLISFRFKSDKILNHLARTGMIDLDSIKALKHLDPRQCLVVGNFTNGFPLYLEILPQSGVGMAGETRPLISQGN